MSTSSRAAPPDALEFFAQRLNSLKAVDELLLSVADHLLQLLDVICTAIEQVLHVSK
jgi:hypothetical protein